MTRKLKIPLSGHLAKPSALRHAERLALNAKHHRKGKNHRDSGKPEFDPRETDRWIDRHGRFTIPHNKE